MEFNNPIIFIIGEHLSADRIFAFQEGGGVDRRQVEGQMYRALF